MATKKDVTKEETPKVEKAPVKKPVAKKATKKVEVKEEVVKVEKPVAKKPVAKKVPAKKAPAKKPVAKEAEAKDVSIKPKNTPTMYTIIKACNGKSNKYTKEFPGCRMYDKCITEILLKLTPNDDHRINMVFVGDDSELYCARTYTYTTVYNNETTGKYAAVILRFIPYIIEGQLREVIPMGITSFAHTSHFAINDGNTVDELTKYMKENGFVYTYLFNAACTEVTEFTYLNDEELRNVLGNPERPIIAGTVPGVFL